MSLSRLTGLCFANKRRPIWLQFLEKDSGFVNPMELLLCNAAKEWTRLYASGAWWHWDQRLSTITCLLQHWRPCFSSEVGGKYQFQIHKQVKSFDAVIPTCISTLFKSKTFPYICISGKFVTSHLCCEIITSSRGSLVRQSYIQFLNNQVCIPSFQEWTDDCWSSLFALCLFLVRLLNFWVWVHVCVCVVWNLPSKYI